MDREKVINELIEHIESELAMGSEWADGVPVDLLQYAVALLKEQDKPKGHWMPYEPDKRGYTDGFTCSRCERVVLSDHYCKMIDFDFCPYCGAYMDNAEGR